MSQERPNPQEAHKKDVPIGEATEVITGDEYIGVFKGRAFVSGDKLYGYLSNMSSKEMSDITSTQDPRLSRREDLLISNLFPKTWDDEDVNYEITVKAKRIRPEENEITYPSDDKQI